MTSYFKHSTTSWDPRDKAKLGTPSVSACNHGTSRRPSPPFAHPHATPSADTIKGLIEQATSDILNTVDWGANMQMVDEVNSTDNSDVYVRATAAAREGPMSHRAAPANNRTNSAATNGRPRQTASPAAAPRRPLTSFAPSAPASPPSYTPG